MFHDTQYDRGEEMIVYIVKDCLDTLWGICSTVEKAEELLDRLNKINEDGKFIMPLEIQYAEIDNNEELDNQYKKFHDDYIPRGIEQEESQ